MIVGEVVMNELKEQPVVEVKEEAQSVHPPDVRCYTDCPPKKKKKKKKITIGLSASIAFKIVNQSEFALGL